MDETRELHCYRIGPDTVVAYDEADARVVLVEMYGEVVEGEACEPLPGDRELAICDYDAPDAFERGCPCLGWARENMTALAAVATRHAHNGHHPDCPVWCERLPVAQWIAQHGRGLLCSTEV